MSEDSTWRKLPCPGIIESVADILLLVCTLLHWLQVFLAALSLPD